ncbi:hypothetical protein UYO_1468 [Lachnospiraceae bacterium JC7]|nr:hypothetical protein UYO_1468 [Lachnospiraceae bacterium JC7]
MNTDKKKAIENGFTYMATNVAGVTAGGAGGQYVENVSEAIQQLTDGMNSYSGSNLGIGQLKGFAAEQYHAGTFNINAALRGTTNRAFVNASTKHASVDISTNFEKNYSLKYYADATLSAKNQAKNVIQAYHEYLSKSNTSSPMSFEEYIETYGYSSDMTELLKSVYYGQGRIIPSDQLSDAIKYLEREIAKESTKQGANRAALLENYKETLKNLSDRIKDGNGTESMPLTKEEAETIAKVCKEGKFDPKDFGLELSDLITTKYILQQAAKAGLTAAALSVVIKTVPDICSIVDHLIKEKEVDPEQLKKLGLDALSGSVEGFLKGSIASAVTICCKSGKLGAFMQTANANVIGVITVLAFDTMKNGLLVLSGKMSKEEMGEAFKEESYVTANAISFGLAGQALVPIPGIGFVIGSVLGTVLGTTMYHAGDQWVNSFASNANYFINYYAELAEIDIDRFIEETSEYGLVVKRMNKVKSEEELRSVLRSSYELLQIKLPWEGDFDEFMGNRTNRLVFS